MEKIDERLISLFEEMMTHTKEFRKKSYEGVFKKGFSEYKELPEEIRDAIVNAPEEEREVLTEHFANVIPEYAYQRIQEEKKTQKKRVVERNEVDYNINMVVYVVPILNYTKDPNCEAVAKRMIELWNEKKVTSMEISYSNYESIESGFGKKFCYITTAVCESQSKPDDCYELNTLRGYRDGYLMQTEQGRQLVEEYYDVAPALVMCIDMQKDSEKIYDNIYKEYLIPCLECIENNRMDECRERYVSMVHDLESRYFGNVH
ncbi:MAG: CFI-box-CTERM domain-containing protein [Lachnospiraceae bacterium]